MPDPRFFQKSGPVQLAALAELTGSVLQGGADPAAAYEDVMPLDTAESQHVSFFDNIKYKEQFRVTKAGACFVAPAAVEFAPDGTALLVSDSPYKAYALAAQHFYPEPKLQEDISAQTVIHETATIGEGTSVEAGAVIGPNVQIGSYCRIGPNTTISHAIIGDHVRLYPGVCVGQDGFGFAIDPAGHVKVPQLGRVIIEDHVEIGANTCIDRGSGPDTVIGQGTWIDNLVQIGHNVKIGKGCIIVAQVGISGSTVIDDFVALGGQAGVAGHLHVGKGARIAAQAGVTRNVPAGEERMGSPALPMRQFMRQVVTLKRLITKDKAAQEPRNEQ